MSKEKKKLTRVEYMEWRMALNELNAMDNKMKIFQLERKLIEKDTTIANYVIREKINKENELSQLKKLKSEEFQSVRAKLEKKIGIPFDKASIDEVTLEVEEIK